MKIIRIVTTTVLVLAIIAVSTTTAAAFSCSDGDICVNQSGWWRDGGTLNASGTPIQAAVDSATAGETICVAAGSYTENVNVYKQLTLRGEGADAVTVTAASSSDHVFFVTAGSVNISGFTATGAGFGKAGIYLDNQTFIDRYADHCNISDNNCSKNYRGIWLYMSRDNTLANNTVNSNDDSGIYLWASCNNILDGNIASNNYYGVHLWTSRNNTLVNNNASSNTRQGIHLQASSNNNMFTGNSCSNNGNDGIYLFDSSNNTFADNNCSNNDGDGISLQSSCSNSCNNTVTGNMVSNNHHGIYLWDASNNTLANNNASNNNDGILLYASSGNTLANNTVNSNNDYGIELDSSSNNLVYNNHFNNTKNAYDSGNNQWNITKTSGTNIIGGPFLGGNYWSDYAGVDNTGDGLGDTMLSHNSSGHITNGGDYHPLVLAAVIPCDGDIYVNTTGWWRDGGTLNASTTPIQAAVDNANAGETICVAAGKYTENVKVNKRLTLRGEGADVVTVIAAGFWRDHAFFVTAGSVNISGFTATGAGWGYAGIYLDNQPSLDSRCADHCNISGNNCSKNYQGIHLYHSGNNTLLSNTVNSNNAHGVYLFASHNNTLDDNVAASNGDYGIHLGASRNNTLVNNNASSNQQGIFMQASSNNNTLARNRCSNNVNNGIHLLDSSNNTFADNNCSNNWDGISMQSSYGNSCSNNTVTGNMVLNNYHGMYLSDSSGNTLASNTASNNYCGIYLYSSCDNDVTCNLVQNNTDCGIYLTSGSTGNNITWNNLVANGELQTDGSYPYQFNNSQSDGVDAINNFWGAGMNNSTIDASIYDDEEGRAEVKFYPFETRPVPCAPAPISEESPAFTTVDAVIALEMAVGSRPLDLHWDVSGDGQVTSLDALMILGGTGTG